MCIWQQLPDRSRRTVRVYGIGDDSRMCHSEAHRQDSWIFLANRVNNVDQSASSFDESYARELILRLNSSLIRVTLENIDRVDAVVQRLGKLITASYHMQNTACAWAI